MKKYQISILTIPIVIVFAVLTIPSVSCAERRPVMSFEQQELRMLELNLREAAASGDTAVLDYYLSDDYTNTDSSGFVRGKRQVLEDIESTRTRLEFVGLDDIRVRIYGDVAVLTARAAVKREYRGEETSGEFRQIRVYVRREGRWQAALMQTTRIVP